MNTRTGIVLYLCVCMSVILCNVGCGNGDEKLAEVDDIKNALVAVGTEESSEDTVVEGM